MVGRPGRSGGRRLGAGRKPGSTQLKKPKLKGAMRATSKGHESPPEVKTKELTAFFSRKPAAASRAAGEMCAP